MKSKKLIPPLRFSLFSENWVENTIDDVLERIVNPVEVSGEKEYRQIGIRSHGKGIFHKEKVLGKELGNKRVFWLEEDLFIVNIVFAWEMAVGKTTLSEKGLIASHRFPMYRPKSQILFLDFILYFFLRKKGKHILELASPGGAGRNKTLGQKEFSKSKIIIPNDILEQQKIASFLSAVDKKITQLQQKKGLLENYKKGVMQLIFSQELRFTREDGTTYPDWEEKKFKDIYSFYSTNSFSRDKLNYESGIVRNVHYGDIHTKFSTLFDINDELVPYINKEVDLSKIKKDSYLKLGDLLIADTSEDYNDIGKTIEVVNLNDEKVISGLHTFHARPNKHKMALGFSGYLLQSWMIRKQVMKIAQGTKVLGISTGRLAEIKFFIPSYEEQSQIAHFLSAIDRKIALVQTQIAETQTFKKGLLQQLFV
ncbi:restriction endonuclease subunit S [Flagellimonas sp.]|jgi:type I restriction enzyme S subunit|uniref:restriction endonuclease subunit S n=1 Tax=Flagellimonas sp. TaxID=2058762 RepID=UPI003BA96AC6